MRCQSTFLVDCLIASTRRLGVLISPGGSNRIICVGPNCRIISWTIPCWNCDRRIWLKGNRRLIWKSPNVCLAVWCHRHSPRWNVISQQILMLGWEICSELREILWLIWFWTFWTPKFSSEFYLSDRKMCFRQFWTHFFWFGILSHHLFFRNHESENIPAISIFSAHHENIQSYILAGTPKDT